MSASETKTGDDPPSSENSRAGAGGSAGFQPASKDSQASLDSNGSAGILPALNAGTGDDPPSSADSSASPSGSAGFQPASKDSQASLDSNGSAGILPASNAGTGVQRASADSSASPSGSAGFQPASKDSQASSDSNGSAGILPALNAGIAGVPPASHTSVDFRSRLRAFAPPRFNIVFLIALPICLALYFFKAYPFPDELASRTFSLNILSPIQRNNIDIAARAVNNTVLEPGEEFSFNRVVGPRSDGKGYRPAPSYLGPDSPATVGGGICLVSSAIYQAALEANCKIVERVPHLRTIASVPPGLDATVWYGRADLKFRNNFSVPIQIAAECKDNNLQVKFLGQKGATDLAKSKLHTVVVSQNRQELLVEAFTETNGKRHLLTRDLYRK
jgi:vancomycin resistance protein VanW